MATIILDAGHGGSDFGATSMGRMEKDDNLRLTLAVGEILQNAGVNVLYTRTEDIYETPADKADKANISNADYLISLHRNSSIYPNQYMGVESLVYNRSSAAARMAENINQQLVKTGFVNQGVNERTNLALLRLTSMPAILVEVGFVNTERDNQIFDSRFQNIAQAVADGIIMSL